MWRLIILMLFLLCGTAARANCPPRPFSYPSDLLLENEAVLIVTHASASFDPRYATKRGVDEAVAFARRQGMPVVYLEDDEAPESYFAADCAPDYQVFSEAGELPLEVRATEVYVVGGHLELCLGRTLQDIIGSWSHRPHPRLRLTFLMDGIYSNGESLRKADPYYAAATRFTDIVSYGRSDRKAWSKLTLLETAGIIEDAELRYAYLQRVLPQFEHTLSPSYRVVLQFNDEAPRLLRRGNARSNMALQFRFVDSARALPELDSGKAGPAGAPQVLTAATAER
jgi:hypothetical protein